MVTKIKYPDPETVEQWIDAVNSAEFYLLMDSAIQYGLMVRVDQNGNHLKGSAVNVDRCLEILEKGKEKGIVPDMDQVMKLATSKDNKYQPTKYQQPGRRCKLPNDYFKTIQTHEKKTIQSKSSVR